MTYKRQSQATKEYKRRLRANINQLKRIRNASTKGQYKKHYPMLYDLLQKDAEFYFIVSVLEYALTNRGTILENKATFWLSLEYLQRINKVFKSKQATNTRNNFYAGIGLWDKVNYLSLKDNKPERFEHFIQVAHNINADRLINLYQIKRYTNWKTDRNYLEEIELRLQELTSCGVKPTNISYQLLGTKGLTTYRDHVYHSQDFQSDAENKYDYKRIKEFIEATIYYNGYCTKAELYQLNLRQDRRLNEKRIDKLWRLFRDEREKQFIYKPPSKEEKERFNLKNDKHIIILKS